MSDDGTRELLARLAATGSRLRVIDNPVRIIPAGLNAAIRVARGRIIVRMDAHTEYAPDYLHHCVAVLSETGADNVGGPWIAEGKGLAGRAVAAAFRAPFAVGGAHGHDPEYGGALDTVYLGCWPIETFHRIGLFDEEFVRSEDDELNLRLTRLGGRIWQSPLIKSWYHPRESLVSLLQQQIQNGYWKVRVVQKHKMPASVRHPVPAVFVLAFVAFGLASPWWSPVSLDLAAIATAYAACNVGASLMAARQEKKLFPLLVLVFACYHFGYGYGFWRGIWTLSFYAADREVLMLSSHGRSNVRLSTNAGVAYCWRTPA